MGDTDLNMGIRLQKGIALLLALVMLLGMMTGCGLNSNKIDTDEDGKGSAAAEGASGYSQAIYNEGEEGSFYAFLGDYKERTDTSVLTARGLEPMTPEAGPADDWGSEPVPFVNPLGSKKLYSRYNRNPLEGSMTFVNARVIL